MNYISQEVWLSGACPDSRATSREEDSMTENGRWKLLVTTSDEAEVYLLKSRLESEGVICRVETLGKYPDESSAGQTREFRAYVALSEFESSQQILDEIDLEEDL